MNLQLDLFGETPEPELLSAPPVPPKAQPEQGAPDLPKVQLRGTVDPDRAARIEGIGEQRIRWHRAYCESVKAGAPDMDALRQLSTYERAYWDLTHGLRDFGDGHTWE